MKRLAFPPITLRARWIAPVVGPPIENGWVRVRNGVVESVGAGQGGRGSGNRGDGPVCDLGDVCVLPGLVNAHTHLEFSDCDVPLGRPSMELCDWIGHVVAARADVTADQRRAAIVAGADESSRTGTMLIGEMATTPWLTDREAPADVEIVPFAEVLGLTEDRSRDRLTSAAEHLGARAAGGSGVAPHAPYSTPPRLIRSCVELAIECHAGVAMHVAESPAERELLTSGGGPFADRLAAMGFAVTSHFPWDFADPVGWLIGELARAPRAMLVHGNDLHAAEIARVAEHPSLSVVMCPRTHAYFGHARHPVAELLAAGVNVALGTDSKASNPDLNLWGEVQHLLRHRQDIRPSDVLTMATVNGHQAIRGVPVERVTAAARAGGLSPGQPAAFNALPTAAVTPEQLERDWTEQVVAPVVGPPVWTD